MFLLVAGSRPEIIKLAPVHTWLVSHGADARWLWTGQQGDLGPDIFDAFGVDPEYTYPHLDPDRLSRSYTYLLQKLDSVLDSLRPRLVIVQGDTISTAAAAQAAFLQKIPVAHVEAGLRTFDPQNPFPEEACRAWIDDVADLKFAPTDSSAKNLSGWYMVTGNTVIDALEMVPSEPVRSGTYMVVTMHRRENEDAVRGICYAVENTAYLFDSVVWPVHPNPIVSEVVPQEITNHLENIELTDPFSYPDMVNLIRHASLVLTDSGGIQEESLALNVPCLVMRETTERPEGVAEGGAKLIGTDPHWVWQNIDWLMNDEEERQAMIGAENPYGDGKAAERIGTVCMYWYQPEGHT